MSGLMDYPNREALGLDPPWAGVEGGGEAEPQARAADAGAAPRLDEMNKQELLEFAKSLGVSPANNDMTKEELRAGVDEKLGS